MADLATIARPYARAAYQYAVEHNVVAEWQAALHGLAIIAKDKRVKRYLSNPELTAKQAAEIFFDIGKEVLQQLKHAGKNFVLLMAERKRLVLLKQVAILFEHYYQQEQDLLNVDVYSAQPLAASYKEKIKHSLAQRFNKAVHLNCHTDPSLLAGARIQIEDLVIDGSAKSKLKRLKAELI